MKTKKFDLQKAIDGHPLVTRDGRKVIDFKYWGKDLTWPINALIEGEKCNDRYTEEGTYYLDKDKSDYDLFLVEGESVTILERKENTIPIELLIKVDNESDRITGGDYIWVKNEENDDWCKRIFISYNKDGVWCVDHINENNFTIKEPIQICHWNYYKVDNKEVIKDIRLDVMINGSEIEVDEEQKKEVIKLLNIK